MISPGTRVGVYEIVALIGAGGMGEVFRARDTKLGREVAIKVLPATFAADPDRRVRFEREARLLATLNHPNIGAIYGVEEAAGVTALVLELVEGQTLAEKLAGRRAEGPGLPMAETLAIARQMADALDAAHERAIVHRDLKPANIIITSDGVVKVLDFGLAKIEPGNAGLSGDRGLTHSPTVIGPTLQGVLLGTAPYMSPEQARGKPVDKRTDIWAFGCVLYEMLTGRRAFGGETTTDSVAAILEREPDWSALPPATPRAVRTLLRRCLEKDPKRRLRDIGDAGVELDDAAASDSSTATPGAAVRTQSWRAASAIVLATAIASGVATAAWLRARSSPVPHRPAQFMFAAPDGHTLDVSRPAPSPDGSRIAFIAIDASGTPSIWMRSLGAIAPQPIAGTQGVLGPMFWSPDGRWLGFFAEGRLKKVEAAGGPVLNIATIANSLGAAWGADNVVIVAPANRTVLHRVSAAGGTPEPITTLNTDRKENSHRWPRFLPDGRHFLFTARSDVKENTTIYVGSIDSREITSLGAAQSNADYAAPGYLLYAQEGTVMARRFDARTLSLSGEAFPVAANVIHTTPSASAFFDVSADGSVLAYEADVRLLATLTWFDRAGRTLGTVGPDKNYTEVRLSPDGRLAAVVIPDPDSGNRDIWVADVRSGALTRFTSTPANDWQVAWSRDGRVLAFASDRNGQSSVYQRAVDGGNDELVLRIPGQGVFPKDWSADGRYMLLDIDSTAGIPGVWALPLYGDRKPFRLSTSNARENEATITRDGRWVALESAESGSTEIYVLPFGKTAKRRVSSGGGTQPRWRADGRELYYAAANGDLMVVAFGGADPIEPAPPVRLFRACVGMAPMPAATGNRSWFDATPDGTRFLIACTKADSVPSAVTVSVDWAASLK